MDSMSEASWRLSWFISSSYSKSEIARSPFTIALAPRARAKSTTSVENGSTRTLPRCPVAASMNSIRSSAENSELVLRTEAATTATISSSNIAAARVITSRWPLVTGSYVPGQTAMRGSGAMDADQGVAIAAFVQERQVQLERAAAVALGDHRRAGRQHGRQRGRQLAPEASGQPIWRVEEDEIVLTRRRRCGAEEPPDVRAPHLRGRAERREVGAHGADRARRAVHERRLRGAARQRLDPQRARAREQVEHARAGHALCEDGEERLAHPI